MAALYELHDKQRQTDYQKIRAWISRYSIYVNGKVVKRNIIGWRTALAHARRYDMDLFNEVRAIEILNIWTGEIITLKEAERRVRQRQSRVISSTT